MEFEIEKSVEPYLEYFKKFSVLKELTKVPFTMRMILTNFSSLKQEIARKGAGYELTKSDIYQIFINNYYHNELKRVYDMGKFNDLLKVEFEIEEESIKDRECMSDKLF